MRTHAQKRARARDHIRHSTCKSFIRGPVRRDRFVRLEPPMSRAWTPAGLALLLGLIAALASAQPAAAAPGQVAVAQAVREQVVQQGWTRVIVQVRMSAGPAMPETGLAPAAVTTRRANILAAQNAV